MYLVVYTLGNKIFAQTASIRFDLECRAMGKWLKRSVHKIGYVKESRYTCMHGLRKPREEITFTARPKIQSQSQIFRYGQSIFCLPHRPNFSDIFDLCLHWVSVVRASTDHKISLYFFQRKVYSCVKNIFSA